jgi:hypothetical protein
MLLRDPPRQLDQLLEGNLLAQYAFRQTVVQGGSVGCFLFFSFLSPYRILRRASGD